MLARRATKVVAVAVLLLVAAAASVASSGVAHAPPIPNPPFITSPHNATFTARVAGTFTVTADGYPAPTFSESGSLDGLTFDTTTGVLSGTPSAVGSFPITFTATNGSGTDTQNFTLTVLGFHITTTSLPNATIGASYSATLQAIGGAVPFKWKTAPKLPKGLKLNGSTGVISGAVTAKVPPGTYSFTVDVKDHTKHIHKTATANLSIAVNSLGG
jgi:hypothetical protein